MGAARRKARRLVLTTMLALVGLCIVSLVTGGITLVVRQPYAVLFPLLLIGVILVAVFGSGYRTTRRGYEETELRKMHALDAVGA
jgi:hypothetical protein